MWEIVYSDEITKNVAKWDPDLLAQIDAALKMQDWRKFSSQSGWLRFVTPYTPQRSYRVLCKADHAKSSVNVIGIDMERMYSYSPWK